MIFHTISNKNNVKQNIFFEATSKVNNANTVGFIGLGNMGKGMAKNLLDKGHEVVAFDANVSVLEDAASLGAKKGASPKVGNYEIVVGKILPKD